MRILLSVLIFGGGVLVSDGASDRKPFVPPSPMPEICGEWRRIYAEFDGVEQTAEYSYESWWVISEEKIIITAGRRGEPLTNNGWRYRHAGTQLDLTVLYGKLETYPSLVKIEGDRLTVCIQNYAERGRPKDFITRPGSGIGKYVYVRMKPSK